MCIIEYKGCWKVPSTGIKQLYLPEKVGVDIRINTKLSINHITGLLRSITVHT